MNSRNEQSIPILSDDCEVKGSLDVKYFEPVFIIEEITDPAEIARSRAQHARAKRNSDWLQSHWLELIDRARGRFIAVAGQEAYIADKSAEAWDAAWSAHPDDDGAIGKYVSPAVGPRIYSPRSCILPTASYQTPASPGGAE